MASPPSAAVRAAIEDVSCLTCGGDAFEVICSAAEVNAHHAYLLRFHTRRLRRKPDGGVPQEVLEDRAVFSQDYATDIVSCVRCGLVLRNPRLTAAAVIQRYAREHYEPEFLEAAFDGQRAFARAKAATLARWLPEDRQVHIVEVGSFVGGFLAAGHERGWSMLGVDPGRDVNAFCRERGLPVYRGTLGDAPLEPRSLDAIAIWNTFDQLPDPRPTVKAARRLLRPGGILAIRVPNGACFRSAEGLIKRLPRPLRGWMRAAMAWNNLLTFPYLYGYSVPILDRLIRPPMQRVAVVPDTLVPLADRHTKRWAAVEERMLKGLTRIIAGIEGRRTGDPAAFAPWIDVYYRTAG